MRAVVTLARSERLFAGFSGVKPRLEAATPVAKLEAGNSPVTPPLPPTARLIGGSALFTNAES